MPASHGHQFVTQLLHFQSSFLLKAWEWWQKMVPVFGPATYMGNRLIVAICGMTQQVEDPPPSVTVKTTKELQYQVARL